MIYEKILDLREKLDISILNGNNYEETYRISTELDELILQYYLNS